MCNLSPLTSYLQNIQALLYRDALVPVRSVSVAVDHTEDGVHGSASTGLQRLTIKEMANEYGRENVACAMEEAGDLVVLQVEVVAVIVVEACHGVLTVDFTAGDEC